MASRASLLTLMLALLAVAPGLAEETNTLDGALGDWLNIPTFTVEAALGDGIDENGELLGEAGVFKANVGVVYCRVSMIDSDQPQKVTVVWYREDVEVARQTLRLTNERSADSASLKIPESQAGSWRVEVVFDEDQLLSVMPFVVGRPTADNAPPLKKNTQP